MYLSKVRGKWRPAFDPAVEGDAVNLYYDDDTPVRNAKEQDKVAQLVSMWLKRAQMKE